MENEEEYSLMRMRTLAENYGGVGAQKKKKEKNEKAIGKKRKTIEKHQKRS